MARNLSFIDYVKEAFSRRVKVPLLGALPANPMALGIFAVLGLANPGFWFLGAAAEIAYLGAMASSTRFQKLVQGERLLQAQREWDGKVGQSVDRLPAAAQKRYRELLGECRRILGLSDTLATDSLGSFRDLRAKSLNQLLWIFLRLLTSREIIRENIRQVGPESLEKEIAGLDARLEALDQEQDPALAKSLERTREIQQKRLDNRTQAKADLQVIEAELQRIERQVQLIREETAVSGKPELLSQRLDAVTSSMGETNRWMDRHSDFFNSLAAGDAETRALADLPRLPEALESE